MTDETEVDPRWLEAVLDRHHRETSIARVLSVKKEEVVNKGDNYVSDICRLILECILGNGDKVTRQVIVKSVPSTENRAKFITEWGVFKKEIIIMSEVIPRMNALLREAGDHGSPLGCNLIYYRPYDLIMMEDMKEKGFKMGNRMTGMNFEEATVALQELARFHAVSIVMKQKSLIDPEDFRYDLFDKNIEMIQAFHDKSLSTLIDVMTEHWGPEWQSYTEALKGYMGKTVDMWKEAVTYNENYFNVLNHGDYWLNNMLFKMMPGQKMPLAVTMIDFQIAFYGCFACDWLYFTSTSLQHDVRLERYNDLLEVYYAALVRRLKIFEIEAPTLDTLKEQIQKKALFGLFVTFFMTPIMKTDPENVMDMEEIMKKVDEKVEVDVNIQTYLGANFTSTMQVLLPEFRKMGVV